MDGSKKCTKCKEVKFLNQFNVEKRHRDGRRSHCRDCQKQYGREYVSKNRSKMAAVSKKWREENSERDKAARRERWERNKEAYRAYVAKRRARQYGVLTEWDLDVSVERRKAIANDPCYYCKIVDADIYHVDHYYPLAKGGDDRWSNLVRACAKCNLSKHTDCGTRFLLRKES